jgi:hypothetical protein
VFGDFLSPARVLEVVDLPLDAADHGAVCVFGDPGRGKTAAVRMALAQPPAGWKVTWVAVPVRPSVAGMRRAVFEALGTPGPVPALVFLP